jgi:putative membrane fusion protein
MLFDDEYKTETAVTYSSAEEISFNGVYVRDEKVLTYNGSGVLDYTNADGGRIAKNSAVAYVYGSEDEIYTKKKIERLNNEIELLENAQSPGTTEATQQEFIAGLISEKYQQLVTMSVEEKYADMADQRNDFLSLLNIYQIVVKKEDNFNSRIDKLKSEVSLLQNRQKNYISAVYSEDPGYFVSYTDGYESKLTLENIDSINADEINKITLENNSSITRGNSDKIGKIISGYKWKMIGLIDLSYGSVQPGIKVKLHFASSSETVQAVIESVKPANDEKHSIIILSCDTMTYNLVQNRVDRVEMILNDYDGIKVPRNAIRFNSKNEKGVYILLGQKVAFKKVDVIYENNDYILSKITNDSSFISAYDDIIVEGANANELAAVAESAEESQSEQPEESTEEGELQSEQSAESGTNLESSTE